MRIALALSLPIAAPIFLRSQTPPPRPKGARQQFNTSQQAPKPGTRGAPSSRLVVKYDSAQARRALVGQVRG